MLDAIRAGDAAGAEELGHAHAALFRSRVLAYLSQNDASTLRPVAGGNP
jgi:DNA-binding GntR family transcriptional regulator